MSSLVNGLDLVPQGRDASLALGHEAALLPYELADLRGGRALLAAFELVLELFLR